ncbi:transmembrane channel-like protein 7 isoform X1 [Crassostrea virginica]
MAGYGNGYGLGGQGQDIPMQDRAHFNPAYRNDSLPRDGREPVVVDIEGIHMRDRHGSDGSREFCPQESTRRRWAATEEPRDTADLINALPSRQLEQIASGVVNKESLRRRKSSRRSIHGTLRAARGKGANELAESFRRNDDFMDEYEGEARTTETLRRMALPMHDKLSIKRTTSENRKQMTLSRGHHHKKIGWWKRTKYSMGISWMHFKHRMAEFAYSLELWRSHMKKIEGHFGTGVTSYFLFLKWIFLLNIPVFILTFGFVVVPQILYRYNIKVPSGYGFTENQTVVSFTGEELLTGGNWFNNTEMYYGFYTDQVIQIPVNSTTSYNMKYAYLFTCGGYYILCLITLAISISHSYKMNYIEGSGTHTFYNVSRVFCGWDYNITDKAASRLKHKSFFNEMKEYLSGSKKKSHKKRIEERCKLLFLRLLTNLTVLGMIAGLSYLVFWISSNGSLKKMIKVSVYILSDMALSLCVSAIFLIFPPIFSVIARFERYEEPKNELYINMFRTMLLKACVVGILVYFWFTDTAKDRNTCWETAVGSEIYRLVLVDFFFILGATFFLEFLRRIFGQYCCKKKQDDQEVQSAGPEFDIGRNTLDLIYSQALCWLGTFYSPLLSLVMMVKLFIIFYVKMISVLQNCQPSLRPWRAAKSHTIFMAFLFFFFLMAMVAVAVGVIIIEPSKVCGPFRGEEKAYSIVTKLIDSWKGDLPVLHDIINFISSPGSIASILVALCVGTYYMRIVMIGHKEMVTLLRQQLHMEGRDKAYLLRMLQDVSHKKKEKLATSNATRLLSPTSNPTLEAAQRSPVGRRVFAKTAADTAASKSPREPRIRRGESNGSLNGVLH